MTLHSALVSFSFRYLLATLSIVALAASARATDDSATNFLAAALREELLDFLKKTDLNPSSHNTVKEKREVVKNPIKDIVFVETTGERLDPKLTLPNPDKTVQVKVLDLRRPARDQLVFKVDIIAPITLSGTGTHYPSVPKSTIEIKGTIGGTATLHLTADCKATLRKDKATSVIEISQKSCFRIEDLRYKVEVTKVGNLGGDAKKLLTSLLQGLIEAEIKKQTPTLEKKATEAIDRATIRPKVNAVLLELMLPEVDRKD